ncbi:MAG: hypothetical protein CMJ76_12425 [Planctomycetaceae bacterium]|nr:hypothetical protein [Planctomycetaceae bacterium]
MKKPNAILLLLSGLLSATPGLFAQQVDFEKEIWPIFQSHCVSCHGADIHEGQLRLDAKAIAFKGGLTGISIVPEKPDQSVLYQRLISAEEGIRMPAEAEALSTDQIALIRHWIEQGANWPKGLGSDAQQIDRHWAYVVPQRPEVPQLQQRQWALNPIDYFILSKLEQADVKPSALVEKQRLIRRLYLDLVGYPPSVEQINAFVRDASANAYDKLVDDLLASPQYGIRWARPWLDLARYADSNGYQADQYRNVWPYRDWVIGAFNSDMPFDQFTVEQLAGDLLENPSHAQQVATGFHRLTTLNVEGGTDPELSRLNQVIDRVNTTATVWLGSTIECSQCHNHKYDPFSQKEYYQLLAYFNNTPIEVNGTSSAFNFYGPTIDVERSFANRRTLADLKSQKAEKERALADIQIELDKQYDDWISSIAKVNQNETTWTVMTAGNPVSANGATLRVLDDQSVLSTGDNPDKDIYEIEFTTDLDNITGFKLEALTHQDLPGKGPGRYTVERPNFVLQEFILHHGEIKLELTDGIADYSQANFDVNNAVDGDVNTAWAIAPQFFKPHQAEFLLDNPLVSAKPLTLKARFVMNYGGSRVIGRIRLSAMTGVRDIQKTPARILELVKNEKRNAKQEKELHDFYLQNQLQYKKAKQLIDKLQKEIDALPSPTALVMQEMETPRETHLLIRGEYKNNGELVSGGTPSVLHKLNRADDASNNRLDLANWLVAEDNPLVARVTVNRWWAEFFGKGIVATEEDFGSQGESPTHPELLDWLAVELMQYDWSMKHIHRLIVTSATYQQDSKARPDLLEQDPANELLARMPRLRMSAEGIRDTMLQISGLLELQMGGEPIYPPQPAGIWRHVGRNAPKYETSTSTNRYRRGIYVIWRRSAPYPAFTNFDAPDRTLCVVNRSRTNTPLQALTLLNDPMYWEMTKALGQDLHAIRDGGLREQVAYAFVRTVSRKPSEREIDILVELYEETVNQLTDRSKDLVALIGEKEKEVSPELGAWYYLANVLLNLDETITRN